MHWKYTGNKRHGKVAFFTSNIFAVFYVNKGIALAIEIIDRPRNSVWIKVKVESCANLAVSMYQAKLFRILVFNMQMYKVTLGKCEASCNN